MRSACDSERLTTVTHGQSWALDGGRHESVQSAFALVRALETSPKLVVRGRIELPTFRFSVWQTTISEPTRSLQCMTVEDERNTPPIHHDPENVRNDLGLPGGGNRAQAARPHKFARMGRQPPEP